MLKRKKEDSKEMKELVPEAQAPEKKKKKRWIIAAGIIVVLLVINIVARMLKPEQLPMVNGSYAQKGDVEKTLDTSGYVSSEVEQTVFSPVTAYISESNVEEGQPVCVGEKLISFDTENLEKAAEEAQLTRQASSYGYQDTLEKANKSNQDLANANTSIDILNQQI